MAGLLSLALAGSGLASAGAAGSAAGNPNTDGSTSAPGQDRTSAIVVLTGAPLATASHVDRDTNGKIRLDARNTRATRAELNAEKNAFRKWLRVNAPKAQVTSSYDISLNAVAVQLNGTPLETLRTAPGVTAADYQGIYHATAHEDPDLALIDTLEGWAVAGATAVGGDPSTWAGHGIKVGIIDTGIDPDHPCFDDSLYPAAAQTGDPALTNNKVIVAKIFHHKAKQLGFTAADHEGHGTHVAGTVGCNPHTPAVVGGAEIGYDPTGVAPGVLLGNYNVLPNGNGSSEDILNGMEAAVADGMDVLNMSLGGGYSGVQDLMAMAVDNIDRAGVVVAVAAGNDGPGASTTGSPGRAERALTVGASTVGQFVGVPVSSGGAQVSVAAVGEFPVPATDLTAPLGVVDAVAGATNPLGLGCGPIAEDLTGQIALISRGSCSFGTKVANAEARGAVAAIIVNNIPGDPISMAGDPAAPSTIPAVQSGLGDRDALMALDGQDVVIGSQSTYTQTGFDNILAGFSSWGPTRVDHLVKPDVVAPGVNVLSAQPLSFCAEDAWVDAEGCWAFYQGTSMATPHVAGMAAVVRAVHADWDAWQVRSAIANTAKIDGVTQTNAITQVETNVQKVGNGLADLDAAVTAPLAFSQTTLSFGAVPSGSGKATSTTVTVSNLSGADATFPVSVSGAGFTADVESVTVPADGSATITVTFAPVKGEVAGAKQAHLYVGDSHLAMFALVQ
ncbi:S8 family serine peptidase [Ornithinimicrobium tianjinense]|uniref:PA domain-containing protein n=1 Tax=Ornithinimicrobium tianjinense TaxID=1195761 RepID=A0A917BWU3_9MICO|nr:S8 family serine peptidase [Ornithinimicrobium tianjinense]GGF60002.1 hypothetical protein GCM10011366_29800 [Ornithinimicrobium tianjinense]